MEHMQDQCDSILDWPLPLPETEYLSEDDARLRDYADAGLDIEFLLAWINCPDPIFRLGRIRFLGKLPGSSSRSCQKRFVLGSSTFCWEERRIRGHTSVRQES